MVKFVITEEAMSPIAQALSGQSRLAGVAAGLKNQMLGMEMDKMREERDQAARQRQLRENLIPNMVRQRFGAAPQRVQNMLAERLGWRNPNPEPAPNLMEQANDMLALNQYTSLPQWSEAQRYANAVNLNNAFGGSGLEAIRGIGLAAENERKQALSELAQAAYESGDVDKGNRYVSLSSGHAYNPFRTDSNGYVLNTGTGKIQATPLTAALIGERNAHSGLYGAQADTERARQADIDLASQLKQRQLEQQPVLQAPTQNEMRLFTRTAGTDPISGKPITEVDYGRMNAVYQFAAANGFHSVAEALPYYAQQETQAPRAAGLAAGAMAGGNPSALVQALPQAQQAVPLAPDTTPRALVRVPTPAMRYERPYVRTSEPNRIPHSLPQAIDNSLKQSEAPDATAPRNRFVDTAPEGGWLNPALPAQQLEQNKQQLMTRLSITPEMSDEQKEAQIMRGLSLNLIDPISAEQLGSAFGF